MPEKASRAARFFYLKLAVANLRRSYRMYIPYAASSSVIFGMFFIITNLVFSKSITDINYGPTLQAILSVGIFVMSFITVGYSLYINSFLIRRRKKEFGLYGILGLEKRHVARIVLWENFLLSASSLVLGIIFGCVFSRLVFMLLLRVLDVGKGSRFVFDYSAFFTTVVIALLIFIFTSVYNLLAVQLAKPVDLLKGESKGEKKVRGVAFITVLGILLLGAAYASAILVTEKSLALLLFWPAVILVIIATWMLFTSGSVFLLSRLKNNKKYYYKPENFISVSGLIYRMKQNAAGLSNICILSTAVIFTVSACCSLYFGQEKIIKSQNPNDVVIIEYDTETDKTELYEDYFGELCAELKSEGLNAGVEEFYSYRSYTSGYTYENGFYKQQIIPAEDYLAISGDTEAPGTGEVFVLTADGESGGSYAGYKTVKTVAGTPFTSGKNSDDESAVFIVVPDAEAMTAVAKDISGDDDPNRQYLYNRVYVLNLDASQSAGLRFTERLSEDNSLFWFSDLTYNIYQNRAEANSLYGGLLFLGAFCTILMIINSVVIIYFKQISEGYDDRERFVVLQKVGMDDVEVKKTINKQILTVFFMPLFAAWLHILAVTHMLIKMLECFMLTDASVTLVCIAATVLLFTAAYVVVYKLTARTYYKIVRR